MFFNATLEWVHTNSKPVIPWGCWILLVLRVRACDTENIASWSVLHKNQEASWIFNSSNPSWNPQKEALCRTKVCKTIQTYWHSWHVSLRVIFHSMSKISWTKNEYIYSKSSLCRPSFCKIFRHFRLTEPWNLKSHQICEFCESCRGVWDLHLFCLSLGKHNKNHPRQKHQHIVIS